MSSEWREKEWQRLLSKKQGSSFIGIDKNILHAYLIVPDFYPK